jgi:ribonuclease HI
MSKHYVCYCDGAATMVKRNGEYHKGAGGYGAILIDSADNQIICEKSEGMKVTTNNEQELLGILNGIKMYLERKQDNDTLCICSDSAYSINCITVWSKKWKANGWKKKGGEIKNLELIKQIYDYFLEYDITFQKVKGHQGVKFNEYVDQLAVAAKKSFLC